LLLQLIHENKQIKDKVQGICGKVHELEEKLNQSHEGK
jgi:hypothetical protein